MPRAAPHFTCIVRAVRVLQGQVTQYDSLTQIKKEKCSLSNLMNVGFQYRIYHHIRKYLVIRTYENIINRLNTDYLKLQ